MKYIRNSIILLFTIFLFSCYQAPESSSGSVSIKLNSSVMRDAPAGFDGELRLAVLDDGDLDSLINITTGINPEISYLGDFPNPLLANNSVPFTGTSGVLSLLNVPADRALSLLIEHYHEEYYFGEAPTYFMTYAGLSDSFEVKGGGSAEVAVTLVPTTSGKISIDVPLELEFSQVWVEIYEPEILDSYAIISGYLIEYNPDTDPFIESYVSEGLSHPELIDMIPGKKLKILVSEYSYPSNGSKIGISGEFELQPGRAKSVPLTYYEYFFDSGAY